MQGRLEGDDQKHLGKTNNKEFIEIQGGQKSSWGWMDKI